MFGEIGSGVLPLLTDESVSAAPWWLVLGIGLVGAVILWGMLGAERDAADNGKPDERVR